MLFLSTLATDCLIVVFVILCFFYRFGFVEFANVEEAKAVFDKQENIEVDGEVLFVNYSARKG